MNLEIGIPAAGYASETTDTVKQSYFKLKLWGSRLYSDI